MLIFKKKKIICLASCSGNHFTSSVYLLYTVATVNAANPGYSTGFLL